MNDTIAKIVNNQKPSRKELKEKVKREKARLRIEKKEQITEKNRKKLAEKAERKVNHKKANAQKKFEAKIQKRKFLNNNNSYVIINAFTYIHLSCNGCVCCIYISRNFSEKNAF